MNESTLILAGLRAPGVVAAITANSPREWEEQKGDATSGGGLAYQGDKLAKVSVTLHMWTMAQLVEWDSFKNALKAPTEKDPSALSIEHPYLLTLPIPITSVVIEDVSMVTKNDRGLYEVKIDMKQYRKPKPAKAQTSGTKKKAETGSESKGETKAKDEADKRIEYLTKALDEAAK